MLHLGVEGVDLVETNLILQTEHKYDGIHPVCELQNEQKNMTCNNVLRKYGEFKKKKLHV